MEELYATSCDIRSASPEGVNVAFYYPDGSSAEATLANVYSEDIEVMRENIRQASQAPEFRKIKYTSFEL